MPVSKRSVIAAAALAAAVSVSAAVYQYRSLHRALQRERAANRLTAGCLHRDFEALRRRLEAAVAQHAVVDEAVVVLEDALAHQTRIDPNPEGGAR